MARKSNKTAHVLNLLSGQDTNEEPEKEPEKSKEAKSKITVEADKIEAETTVKTDKPEAEAAPAPVKPQPAPPEVPSNISIIDSGAKEADPIAERIHEELLKELEQEQDTLPEEEAPAKTPTPQKEPEEEILELSPEPPAEPEPDYVMLNIMQRVVEDKIIYFMKQFEVCTCDRCKADTIALTLSGLPAKYRIVDKNAVDPLVSYYTNRLISQVTVEALKACIQVKDNPRH